MASSRGRWASPERTVVWTEPPPKTTSAARRHAHAAPPAKVPVVYYLSRNGQLDHPHFMEVPVSNPHHGLCLRDVLDRLTVLRGAGMADAYSWSSKRSYKTGYVWHDLTADDPVHPASGAEYVLKGSELLRLLPAPAYPRDASAGSSSSSSSTSSCQAGNEHSKKMPAAGISRAHGRRKNWSSFDLGEYRVAAARGGAGADAATQTDERRGRRGRGPEPTTELGADEISPPPSSSSPDTLETLIKNDASNAVAARREEEDAGLGQQGVIAGGRMRASAVLMQLISCGSIPAPAKRDAGPGGVSGTRLPRGRSDLRSSTAADGFSGSIGVGAGMEREYFSGSLVETKKSASGDRAGHGGELGALKRSSSYNADRGRESAMNSAGCKLELAAEEVDGVRARCIPAGRKPSTTSNKSPTNHVPRVTAEHRLPRGRSDLSSSPGADAFSGSIGIGAGMEREYFSGSLVETKKLASGNRAGVGELGVLKRSSSYNADSGRRARSSFTKNFVCVENFIDYQLISSGSIPAAAKQDAGPGGVGAARYTEQLPRGRSDLSSSTAADTFSGSISAGMEREYFSSSLVETRKTASGDRAGHGGELGALKRSSSYNADRGRESTMNTGATTTSGGCKLELAAEERDGVRARRIPAARKPSSSNNKSPTTHIHVRSRGSNQPKPTND